MLRKGRPLRDGLAHDTRGLSTVEYVIILALVAIVGFVLWQMLGRSASSRSGAADGVVNGLHTTSSTEDHSGGGGGRRTSGAGGTSDVDGRGGTSMLEEMSPEEEPQDSGLWKWGALALVVFGGMIFWLAKEKSK